MDFTQIPVSQWYKYLLVMIDTFTGWIEGFPTRTEKAEEVVKNCSSKSFWDLVSPGHYKVTMGYHLLIGHYLLSPLCLKASVFRKSRKSQPILKITNKKVTQETSLGWKGALPIALLRTYIRRRQWHPTPVLLPGKSHGQRSLVGYSPQSLMESDMTEVT